MTDGDGMPRCGDEVAQRVALLGCGDWIGSAAANSTLRFRGQTHLDFAGGHSTLDLMKLVKRILVFLVVFVALFAVVGFLLPAQYHVERSTVVKAPPEKIFGIAADLRTWEEWTAWNLKMDPTMKRTFSGPTSGVGTAVSWDGKKAGHGDMKLTKVTAPTELAYDLSFEHGRFKSVGTMQFEPADDGTTVTWTDDGDVGGNPFYRWMGLGMDKFMGPDFEKGLAGLKALAERK